MKRVIAIAAACITIASHAANAQSMRDQLRGMFADVLQIQIAGSPGEHANHFSPANVATSASTIDAIGNFVSSSVSTFSFSSTAAGVTYDLSSGAPVATRASLGPIFAERAQTLGRGRINIGWNFSYLNQSKLRGTEVEDIRFTFIHEDVGAPGLGDSDNELDTIDMKMNLDLNTSVLVFFTSYGISDDLDIGFALPIVNVEMKADPYSSISSFTLLANDSANHFFGGTRTEPVLDYEGKPIKEDAVGIGDILLRGKFHLQTDKAVQFAALMDLRLPTGDEEDFLGAGGATWRTLLIAATTQGNFGPHINVGYTLRTADQQRDDIELLGGFDQKITDGFTVAADFLGRYQVGSRPSGQEFPEPVTIQRGAFKREVELTNLENRERDNIMDLSVGFRFAPKPTVMVVGNVIVPINGDGLRSDAIPTIGIEFTL